MLVARRDGRLALIAQPDHAAFAGALAEHWGNNQFEVPVPREALICAAAHHDDGWLELDGRPMFNAQERRPAHFTELPLTETAGPYSRGVESVYARDPHAGALVSMHFSGFYTSRWGAGGGPPSDSQLAIEIVATQEARWMPALREAWGYRGRRSAFDAATWHAYEVLQAVDLLSLAHGLIDLELAAGEIDEAVDVAITLAHVDQVTGPRLVTSVPLAAGGPYATIAVMPAGSRRVRLDPYPLREPELTLPLTMRELEDRPYQSADEAARAFHAAPVRELTVTLSGPA